MKGRLLLLIGLIAVAISTRFMPHAPNFTAVGAVALFGGAVFKNNWRAFLIPITALFLSDLVLNNLIYAQYYEGFSFFTEGFYWIYGAFLLSVLIGRAAGRQRKWLALISGGIASTLLFYLLTNFGAWIGNPIYTQDFAGLMTSYAAGLPFLANQFAGTFFYGALLFGAAYALEVYRPATAVNA